ncbi:hypothetical protein BC628DRAFT_1460116 [Trametes gibbosa]|nr:hypothetical protein BC628DRAFT_1460116 [Trametes gibbosa]
MSADNSSVVGEESEDDFDWEEVEVAAPALTLDAAQLQAETAAHLQTYYGEAHEPEAASSEKPHIEITIQTKGKRKGDPKKNERAVQLAAERIARLDCHKVHTVALLVNAKVRNHWLNDPLLHARLMSLTPIALQNTFATIHKSRVPEAAQRGRLFESAVTQLAEWWAGTFKIVPTGHIRSRTFEEVQKTIRLEAPAPSDSKGKGKGKARALADDEDDEGDDDDDARFGVDGERIRSAKSLMKHALMRRGSRDTSAQLFTALCRALSIPARLVVSLQSVPWQAGVGKPKLPTKKKKANEEGGTTFTKAKGKAKAAASEDEDDDMEEVSIPGSSAVSTPRGRTPFPGSGQRVDGASPATSERDKGKKKAPPVIRLRKSRGQKLGSAETPEVARPRPREHTPDPTATAPVFWTEVFSRADARWIPVDPVRVIVNRRKAFDPTPNPNAPNAKSDKRRPVRVENRMVYVLAFEEDGYARDVTPRYAREYGAKVSKIQQGGKGRREWWERILRMVRRPYRLQRDDVEDEELQVNQMTEGMPTSMAGFKDHPLYVLERHLKRDEVVEPPTELGKFRGESVYPRGNVLQLKTAENWMRQGRKVREGAQPLKWAKQRAVTVNKKRAIELALADRRDRAATASASSSKRPNAGEDGDGEQELELSWDATGGPAPGEGFASEEGVMQGLYAEHQTELYRPDPVVDGKIPKNDFGNIDLYVPTMLPAGAVHMPYKGTAKLARQLGFDYAEAVTGFEFRKGRAFPIITGVVVAVENQAALFEAYWEAEVQAEAKRNAKRQEQVLRRWTKLVQGLRIRQRLLEQYADRGVQDSDPAASSTKDVNVAEQEEEPAKAAGGFLTGVDDVVQPYTLPRNLRSIVEHAGTRQSALGERAHAGPGTAIDVDSLDDDEKEEDDGGANAAVGGRGALQGREDTLRVISAHGIEDGGDEDAEMEDVAVAAAPQLNGAPKTMQELAEAAARHVANDDEESAGTPAARTPAAAPEQKAAANAGSGTGRSTRAARSGARGASRSGTRTPAAARRKGRGKAASASTSTSMSTSTPRRARKRKREEASEDEGLASSEDDDERTGDDGASGVDPPPPAAANTPRARARPSAAPVPPSTRVLRTRAPKSASAVQEEREREAAYRRAVAE